MTPFPPRSDGESPRLRTDMRDAVLGAIADAQDWTDLTTRLEPLGILVEVETPQPLEIVRRTAPAGGFQH